jgi:hypothetical protein
MKKSKQLFIVTFFLSLVSYSQQKPSSNKNKFADLAATVRSSQGSVAASYVYKYALMHCQQFNHMFGSASIQKLQL